MYTIEMQSTRIKLMALSRIRQIEDEYKRNPQAYRNGTREYCDAMYDILSSMTSERLHEVVDTIADSYREQGMYDDGYVADSIMMLVLAEYQNEIGEENIYDMGWTSYVEDFFRTEIA